MKMQFWASLGLDSRIPIDPSLETPSPGVVTFVSFACQSHCATKIRVKGNQSFRALEGEPETAESGIFLANVMVWTAPARHLAQ
jgi:hypothetical protein